MTESTSLFHIEMERLKGTVQRHRTLKKLVPLIEQIIEQQLVTQPHHDLRRWQEVLSSLPSAQQSELLVDKGRITIEADYERKHIPKLKQLSPWRKGPFQLGGLHIDTEWRSDWKWERLLPHIHDLKGRRVLDVGCGSGYHLWRSLEAGASFAMGVDPGLLFWAQFLVLKHHLPNLSAYYLPCPFESMPDHLASFDTTFSMGVLYHCRAPLDHLQRLKRTLRPGGELVLETLIIEGGDREVLTPLDRYAAMRNVWFIPSTGLLATWLTRAGFADIEVVDTNWTTPEEQRATAWMPLQSLQDFLDPHNPERTREGYPAPLRAVIRARRPQ